MNLDSLYSAGLLSSRSYGNLEKLSKREEHHTVGLSTQKKIKLLDESKKPTFFSEIFKRTAFTDPHQSGRVLLANLSELNQAIKVIHSQNQTLSTKATQQLLKVSQEIEHLSKKILSPQLKNSLQEASQTLTSHLENDEIKWIAQIDSRLASQIQNAKAVLTLSESPTLPLEERMKLAPKVPSSGMGVSFFVSTLKVALPDPSKSLVSQLSGAKMSDVKATFIAKSASREEARSDINHFPQGQGPMREKIADTLQSVLGLDCGVPPTTLATLPGSVFSGTAPLNKHLDELNQLLPVKLDAQKVILYGGNPCDISAFKTHIKEACLENLKEVIGLDRPLQEELTHILASLTSEQEIILTDNLKAADDTQQSILHALQFIQSLMTPTAQLDQKIQETWEEIAHPTGTPSSSLVSCQQLVANCVSLEAIKGEERLMISSKQFEKCLVDILMPNSDRGLQNILVKKTPLEKFSQTLTSSLNMNATQFGQLIKDLKLDAHSNMEEKCAEFISVIKMLKGSQYTVSSKQETLIHAGLHALAHDYPEVLELVMIDNSQSLPSFESPDGQALRSHVRSFTAKHEWAGFPQVADLQITGSNRQTLLKLDIEACVNRMKSDQLAHSERFGRDCDLNNSCFDLLKINIMFLKAGVLNGLSLSELNAFTQKSFIDGKVAPSPLAKLYITEFLDAQGVAKTPDWTQIQLAINTAALKSK